MQEIFGKHTAGAVVDVFEKMAGSEVTHGEPFDLVEVKPLGDISVIIGFSGSNVQGTFVLHYNKEMALYLAEKIFMIESQEIDADVLDAVGEVTNMISGKIKTDVVNSGEVPEFNITVPTIILGQQFQTHIKMEMVSKIYPYHIDDNKTLNLELKVKALK